MTNNKKEKEMSNVIAVNDLENQFFSAIKRGIEAWGEAGILLVKISEKDPSAIDRVKERSGLSMGVINTFLRIGKGELLTSLVTAPEFVKRLPISDQKKIVSGTVEALVLKPDGSTDTIRVDILRSDPRIIKQVVGRDGIRTLAEQKQTIVATVNSELATKAAKLSKKIDSPWWTDGKCVVITSGKYSRRDLQTMLNSIL